MSGNVPVRDSNAVPRLVDADNVSGVDTQVVKLRIGTDGEDGGLVAYNNALPVMLSAFFKRLFQVFSRFRFSTASALVVDANGSNIGTVTTVTTVTTCSTVSAVTQANTSIGNIGINPTIQMAAHKAFGQTNSANFIRS